MASNSRKRANPFASEDLKEAKVLKYDLDTIQKKTLNILMKSSQKANTNGASSQEDPTSRSDSPAIDTVEALADDISYSSCIACRRPTPENHKCSFCYKVSCDSCSTKCEMCSYMYCSFCSIPNYDTPDLRIFCLSCNEEERRSRSFRPSYGNEDMDVS